MDNKEQYILDLEKRLEEQEEAFEKEIQSIIDYYKEDEHVNIPIDVLCGIQKYKDPIMKAYALRYIDERNSTGITMKYVDIYPKDYDINIDFCKMEVIRLIKSKCESLDFSFISKIGENETIVETMRTFYTTLLKASNSIAYGTRRAAGNFVYCSVKYEKYFSCLDGYTGYSGSQGWLGRFTIIYNQDEKRLGDVIVGYKGKDCTDCGLVVCPVAPTKDTPIEECKKAAIAKIDGWENYYKVIRII